MWFPHIYPYRTSKSPLPMRGRRRDDNPVNPVNPFIFDDDVGTARNLELQELARTATGGGAGSRFSGRGPRKENGGGALDGVGGSSGHRWPWGNRIDSDEEELRRARGERIDEDQEELHHDLYRRPKENHVLIGGTAKRGDGEKRVQGAQKTKDFSGDRDDEGDFSDHDSSPRSRGRWKNPFLIDLSHDMIYSPKNMKPEKRKLPANAGSGAPSSVAGPSAAFPGLVEQTTLPMRGRRRDDNPVNPVNPFIFDDDVGTARNLELQELARTATGGGAGSRFSGRGPRKENGGGALDGVGGSSGHRWPWGNRIDSDEEELRRARGERIDEDQEELHHDLYRRPKENHVLIGGTAKRGDGEKRVQGAQKTKDFSGDRDDEGDFSDHDSSPRSRGRWKNPFLIDLSHDMIYSPKNMKPEKRKLPANAGSGAPSSVAGPSAAFPGLVEQTAAASSAVERKNSVRGLPGAEIHDLSKLARDLAAQHGVTLRTTPVDQPKFLAEILSRIDRGDAITHGTATTGAGKSIILQLVAEYLLAPLSEDGDGLSSGDEHFLAESPDEEDHSHQPAPADLDVNMMDVDGGADGAPSSVGSAEKEPFGKHGRQGLLLVLLLG